MKSIFLFAAWMALVVTGYAQSSFSISPNSGRMDTTMSDAGLVELNIGFHNLLQRNVTLAWERISGTIPGGWDMTICDNALCYPISRTSGTMDPIPAGGSAYLKLGCNPYQMEGSAILVYRVWDISTPADSVHVTYTFHRLATAVTVPEAAAQFSVSPVPADDALFIGFPHVPPNQGTVRLYDLSGQLLRSQPASGGSTLRIDVHSLLPGIYLLRYEGKAGSFTQKVAVAR
ncbi:MAG: Secretion system C-terminal sorting domain [Bacteroidota bacterium]